jgi:hypothetical protein
MTHLKMRVFITSMIGRAFFTKLCIQHGETSCDMPSRRSWLIKSTALTIMVLEMLRAQQESKDLTQFYDNRI